MQRLENLLSFLPLMESQQKTPNLLFDRRREPWIGNDRGTLEFRRTMDNAGNLGVIRVLLGYLLINEAIHCTAIDKPIGNRSQRVIMAIGK